MPRIIALALVVAFLSSSCTARRRAARQRSRCEEVCEAGGMKLKGLQLGKIGGRMRANTAACLCELEAPTSLQR